MSEKANYVTCPRGHKVFLIWSDLVQCFAFTCDECEQHSTRAVTVHGVIEITIVKKAGQS